MRHIPSVVCALGLLSSALGCACCDHVAGVCDCQLDPRGCERYSPAGAIVATPAPVQVLSAAPTLDAPKPLVAPR